MNRRLSNQRRVDPYSSACTSDAPASVFVEPPFVSMDIASVMFCDRNARYESCSWLLEYSGILSGAQGRTEW